MQTGFSIMNTGGAGAWQFSFSFCLFGKSIIFAPDFGVWRSLVAYASGGRGVASSNLVTPTNQKILVAKQQGFVFFRTSETEFRRRTEKNKDRHSRNE